MTADDAILGDGALRAACARLALLWGCKELAILGARDYYYYY